MADTTRTVSIVGAIALLVALPFLFRRDRPQDQWRPGNPVLIVISPHNEAIHQEFALAFSDWHQEQFGVPVRIDWRTIGGTTEIMRYLESEFAAAFRAWAIRHGHVWPGQAASDALSHRFNPNRPPTDARQHGLWEQQKALWDLFRQHDTPDAFGAQIDLFFGGGTYDHGIAGASGFTVAPWDGSRFPSHLFYETDGIPLIPVSVSGEQWRSDTYFGTCLSAFGICSNPDRLAELGIDAPPRAWRDLTDPRLFRHIGVADPTKSGSIAKAFEMIIQQECMLAVLSAGYTLGDIEQFEEQIQAAGLPPGELPPAVPQSYQDAVEAGCAEGLNLIRMIGANARYFTDSAGKVPIDVSRGNAAAGIAIDFFGRYQTEFSRDRDGVPRMEYHTPQGGSSISADPISLLRGAPNRELALRFLTFVLGTEGQQLWNYRPGTPGGPHRFALRRLPIRRDFYPAPDRPEWQEAHLHHMQHVTDNLADPAINPFVLAESFTYIPRWTAAHFGVHRNLIRAMAMDAGQELQRAWRQIHTLPEGPRKQEALNRLLSFPDRPEPLTWTSALALHRTANRMDLMREWTLYFRDAYREAFEIAAPGSQGSAFAHNSQGALP